MQTVPIEQSIDPAINLPPFHTAERLRVHPRFSEAVDCLVDQLATLYINDRRLRGLIEYDRAVCFMLIVCLDAVQRIDRPDTWLTLARLESILPVTRIEGGRRITELVTEMRRDGFLRAMPAPHDGRVRLLIATEKMLAADREWLAVFHAPLALLFDDEGYRQAVRQDVAYQRAYRTASLKTLPLADRIVGGNPVMDYFLRENVGVRVLMVLMQTIRNDPQCAHRPGLLQPGGRTQRCLAHPCPQSDARRRRSGFRRTQSASRATSSRFCHRCSTGWNGGSRRAWPAPIWSTGLLCRSWRLPARGRWSRGSIRGCV